MNDRRNPALRNTPSQLTDMAPPSPTGAATSSKGIGPTGDPTMGPLVVTAYSGREGGSLLLDLATGRYVVLQQFYSVTPSPDGTRDLVYTGRSNPWFGIRNSVTKVVDPIGGDCRGTPRASTAGWSQDSREILITESTGFAIINADDPLDVTVVAHDGIGTLDGLGLRYVWTPDGNEIALTQSRGDDPLAAPKVTGIRFYNRSGEYIRTLPATAALTRESGFSPDRAQMALQTNPPFGDSIEVVGVTDGKRRQTLRLPEDQPSPRLIQFIRWANNHHLIVRDFVSRRLWLVVVESAEFRAVVLPDVIPAEELHIGSSVGLVLDAHGLTFGPEWPPPGPYNPYNG